MRIKISKFLNYEMALIVFVSVFFITGAIRTAGVNYSVINYISLFLILFVILRHSELYTPKPLIFAVGFLGFGFISALQSVNVDDAFYGQLIILFSIFTFVVLYNCGRIISSPRVLAVILILTALFLSAAPYAGFTPYGAERIESSLRYSGVLNNPNELAAFVFLSIVALLFIFSKYSSIRAKLFSSILLIFVLTILVSTGSRKFMLYAVVAFLAYIIFNAKSLRFILASIVSIPFIAYFSFQFFNFELLLQRFMSTGIAGQTRFGIILSNIEVFMDNFLFGVGGRNVALHSAFGLGSHNQFIEPLVAFGLIGGGLFFATYVYSYLIIFRNCRQSISIGQSRNGDAVFVLLLTFSTILFWFGYSYHESPFYWGLTGMLIGLSQSVSNSARNYSPG